MCVAGGPLHPVIDGEPGARERVGERIVPPTPREVPRGPMFVIRGSECATRRSASPAFLAASQSATTVVVGSSSSSVQGSIERR
jgi:hypothetical protein